MIDKRFTLRSLRFSITGLLTTGIHVLVAVAVIHLIYPSPVLANGSAFILSTCFSFYVNTVWSFSAKVDARTLYRYITTALIGLTFAVGIADLAEHLDLHYLLGIALVVCTVLPVNFMLHHLWTYR